MAARLYEESSMGETEFKRRARRQPATARDAGVEPAESGDSAGSRRGHRPARPRPGRDGVTDDRPSQYEGLEDGDASSATARTYRRATRTSPPRLTRRAATKKSTGVSRSRRRTSRGRRAAVGRRQPAGRVVGQEDVEDADLIREYNLRIRIRTQTTRTPTHEPRASIDELQRARRGQRRGRKAHHRPARRGRATPRLRPLRRQRAARIEPRTGEDDARASPLGRDGPGVLARAEHPDLMPSDIRTGLSASSSAAASSSSRAGRSSPTSSSPTR